MMVGVPKTIDGIPILVKAYATLKFHGHKYPFSNAKPLFYWDWYPKIQIA